MKLIMNRFNEKCDQGVERCSKVNWKEKPMDCMNERDDFRKYLEKTFAKNLIIFKIETNHAIMLYRAYSSHEKTNPAVRSFPSPTLAQNTRKSNIINEEREDYEFIDLSIDLCDSINIMKVLK